MVVETNTEHAADCVFSMFNQVGLLPPWSAWTLCLSLTAQGEDDVCFGKFL